MFFYRETRLNLKNTKGQQAGSNGLADIYLLEVTNEHTRTMCKICLKLTHCSGVLIVDFEQVNPGWEKVT